MTDIKIHDSSKIPINRLQEILTAQENEITEYHIYSRLAHFLPDEKNRKILSKIAQDEKSHHDFWKTFTHREVKPSNFKIFIYLLLSKLLGFTFAVKLMEKGEELAQVNYDTIAKYIPHAKEIEKEEKRHETALLAMLDEERLRYVGSMILGVNDALVELTGALAGFTLALQNTKIIAMTGLITGIAASLSMAASEYLSTKAEKQGKGPHKSIPLYGKYVCLYCFNPHFSLFYFLQRVCCAGLRPHVCYVHHSFFHILHLNSTGSTIQKEILGNGGDQSGSLNPHFCHRIFGQDIPRYQYLISTQNSHGWFVR